MRRSPPAKPRLPDLVEACKVAQRPRNETALEVQFRTVEYLLDAMDFLAGAAARRTARRRR